jgi:probable HAF family extracellular repeat protein
MALGINNAGQVVGRSTTAEGYVHAFVTGFNGVGMTDLNTLVDLPKDVILIVATGINNNGQVIATSVPEPGAYALLLAGLVLIGFIARRKRFNI